MKKKISNEKKKTHEGKNRAEEKKKKKKDKKKIHRLAIYNYECYMHISHRRAGGRDVQLTADSSLYVD